MLTRRLFASGLLTALAAPAVIRTPGVLMALAPKLILWGDGVHDDAPALQGLLDGKTVWRPDLVPIVSGLPPRIVWGLHGKKNLLRSTLHLRSDTKIVGCEFIIDHDGYGFDASGGVRDVLLHGLTIDLKGDRLRAAFGLIA